MSKENDPEDWNLVLGGVTLRKELIVRNKNDTANGWRQAVRCMTDTTNIILGKLTAPNSYFRMGVDDGAKFIIAGGATLSEAPIIGYGNGAEVIVRNIPISRKIYQDVNTGGRFIYDCAGNSISHHSTTDYARGMQMYMETRVDGALDDSSWFLMGLENGKGVSILDLCGTVQRISRIEAIVQGGVLAQSGIVTSDMPATLTMTSDKTYTNSCIFAGAASLEQAGGGVLYLTASSTSTGMLHIANGTLVLADSVQNGAAWAGEEVRISGGVIDVRHATSFAKNVDFNFVGETGKINIPSGINIQCRYIYADGLRQKIGVYTADNFGDHVSGGGAIVSRGLANGTVFLLR